MQPNYSGRLWDKAFLILLARICGSIRENPDEEEYPEALKKALKPALRAAMAARNELQIERDPQFKP